MTKHHLTLKAEDAVYLEKLLSKGSLPVKTFKRATALLELHRGKSYEAIAQTLGKCYQTISIWCHEYEDKGLTMLYDEPRAGHPIEIDGNQRAKITALACSTPPQGHKRWSLRLLADKVVELGICEHLSHNHAGEILKKTNSSLI